MRLEDKCPRRDVGEFFRLMRRQFTPDEWRTIEGEGAAASGAGEDAAALRSFYRHWCLKESFVKAEGSGLRWDLQRISFKVGSIVLIGDRSAASRLLKVRCSAVLGT